jgi:LysM repeat protein
LKGAAAELKTAAAADLKAAGGLGGLAASSTFTVLMEAARRELDAGRLADVHRQLSSWYDDPRLSSYEQQRLTELLDQLAGTVVYSTQSLLEPEHEVQPGERLEDIGQRLNVPWQLLAKVNGIEDPQSLRPGERLKVVKGPFSAVVNLQKRQLTLMLGGMYAGRFPIGLGREHPAVEGNYVVAAKVPNPTYYGADRAIEPEDPSNPLGKRWIDLGNQLSIHGTNDPKNIGRTDLPGCISLSPHDAEDVFDILSIGSKVIIRR